MPRKPAVTKAVAKKTKSSSKPKAKRASRVSMHTRARELSDLGLFLEILEDSEGDSPLQEMIRTRLNLPSGLDRAVLIEQVQQIRDDLEREIRGKLAAPPTQQNVVMAYQIKITLQIVSPPVWRRVLLRSDATLETLHEVIQSVMPWDGGHLHDFEINHLHYGSHDSMFGTDADYDEAETRLYEVLGRVKAKGRYEYDFGDGWRHEILIEKILALDPTLLYPLCVAGARAAPPDDCGGPWGYADALEALANPTHSEHEDRLEWFGEGFDPEAFDLEGVNNRLAFLRSI